MKLKILNKKALSSILVTSCLALGVSAATAGETPNLLLAQDQVRDKDMIHVPDDATMDRDRIRARDQAMDRDRDPDRIRDRDRDREHLSTPDEPDQDRDQLRDRDRDPTE